MGSIICISNKSLGDADATGRGTRSENCGLEDVTGGFILPVHRGEKKSQEGRDVVVWRSPVRPGVVIIGSVPCPLSSAPEVGEGRCLGRCTSMWVTLAPFPDGTSTCNLHF